MKITTIYKYTLSRDIVTLKQDTNYFLYKMQEYFIARYKLTLA